MVEAAATVEAKVLPTIHQVQACQRVEAVVGVVAEAVVKAVVEAAEVTKERGKKVKFHSRFLLSLLIRVII